MKSRRIWFKPFGSVARGWQVLIILYQEDKSGLDEYLIMMLMKYPKNYKVSIIIFTLLEEVTFPPCRLET